MQIDIGLRFSGLHQIRSINDKHILRRFNIMESTMTITANEAIMNKTKETAEKAARLIMDGKDRIAVAEILQYNPLSVDRLLDKVLPNANPVLYKELCDYTDSRRNKPTPSHSAAKQTRKTKASNISSEQFAIQIADYIIENSCSISEANKKFGLAPGNMHYINNVLPYADGKKFKQVRNIIDSRKKPSTSVHVTQTGLEKVTIAQHNAARGNYTGSMCIVPGRGNHLTDEQRLQNSHNICDFILANNTTANEAAEFFGMNSNVAIRAIDEMIEFDYDKYFKVKMIQKSKSPRTIIKPNPKDVVETEPVVEAPVVAKMETTEISEPVENIVPVEDEVTNGTEEPYFPYVTEKAVEEPVKRTLWQKIKYVLGFGA
jgi:hypothetical protein